MLLGVVAGWSIWRCNSGVRWDINSLGIDNQDATLALARELDTSAAIFDARVTQPEDVLAQLFGDEGKASAEHGVDAVLILPESQKAFDHAISLLRNHGSDVVVSFPSQEFNFSARDMVFRQIELVGMLPGRQSVMKAMLRFAAEFNVRAGCRSFSLEGWNVLVVEYHRGGGGEVSC